MIMILLMVVRKRHKDRSLVHEVVGTGEDSWGMSVLDFGGRGAVDESEADRKSLKKVRGRVLKSERKERTR